MREILFRGKRIDNGEWIEGHFFRVAHNHFITKGEIEIRHYGYAGMGEDNEIEEIINYLVDPNTIGQYTGLKDKNGTKIFEGDVVQYGARQGNVLYEHGIYTITDFWEATYDSPGDAFSEGTQHFEVIGNIYDKEGK